MYDKVKQIGEARGEDEPVDGNYGPLKSLHTLSAVLRTPTDGGPNDQAGCLG